MEVYIYGKSTHLLLCKTIYDQNNQRYQFSIGTKNKILVEESPYDKI